MDDQANSAAPANWDPAVGIVVCVISILTGLAVTALVLLFGTMASLGSMTVGPRDTAPLSAVMLLIVAVAWVLCAIHFAAGLAMRQSKLWGFIVCMIVGVLGALGARSCWSTIDVLLVIYCVVRLAGQLGPKPS